MVAMWQKARVLSGQHNFAGRTMWVRCGHPALLRTNLLKLGANGRALAGPVIEGPQFETHLFTEGYTKPIAAEQRFLELLPEFAEHVEPESLADWLARHD